MVAKQEVKRQCVAITKKGNRCKWNALPNETTCHVHIKTEQAIKKVQEKSQFTLFKENHEVKKKVREKLGNIYVYTYAHMLQSIPTQTPYLHYAGPTDDNCLDKRKTSPFDTTEKILLKVGYTRKKPEVRVKEWKEQCGHSDFVLIYPGCIVPDFNGRRTSTDNELSGLRKIFKKLSLGRKREEQRKCDAESNMHIISNNINHTSRKYKHLNQEKTCFVTSNPYQVEQSIHKILRHKFGAGKLYCEGCIKQKLDSNNRIVETIGVHTEWFLIPRNQVSFVWDLIEGQCHFF